MSPAFVSLGLYLELHCFSASPYLLPIYRAAEGPSWLPAPGDLFPSALNSASIWCPATRVNISCLVLVFNFAVHVSSCQPYGMLCKGVDHAFSTFLSLQPLTQCCVQASVKYCWTRKPNPITQNTRTNLFFEPMCLLLFYVPQSSRHFEDGAFCNIIRAQLALHIIKLSSSCMGCFADFGQSLCMKGKGERELCLRQIHYSNQKKKKHQKNFMGSELIPLFGILEHIRLVFWKRNIVM